MVAHGADLMSSFRQAVDAPTLIHSKTALPSARRSDPSASVGARPTSAIVRATSSLWSCFARFHRACWHGVRPKEFQSPPGQIGTDVVSGDPQFGFTAGAFQLNVRYPKRLNQLLHSASAVPAFDRQHHVSDGHVRFSKQRSEGAPRVGADLPSAPPERSGDTTGDTTRGIRQHFAIATPILDRASRVGNSFFLRRFRFCSRHAPTARMCRIGTGINDRAAGNSCYKRG